MVLPARSCAAEQRFIERAIRHLERKNVDLVLLSDEQSEEFSGDYETGRLRITTRPCSWFQVFLHEYCHFRQDVDGTPWFHDPAVSGSWELFFDWLEGEPAPVYSVLYAVRHIQRCELDCERRALRIARRYGFSSVDPRAYAASANAYVWQHEAARQLRAWNRPRRPPNSCGKILRLCPDKLMRTSHIHKLPMGYLQNYKRLSTRRRFR